DRVRIAELLIKLFTTLKESKISVKILSFLFEKDSPQLQFQAARFVCHYCQGPRIPNTPKTSFLHPVCSSIGQKLVFLFVCIELCCAVLYCNCVEALRQLFKSEDLQLQSKVKFHTNQCLLDLKEGVYMYIHRYMCLMFMYVYAIEAIGYLAMYDQPARQFIINAGVFNALIDLVTPKQATYFYIILFANNHNNNNRKKKKKMVIVNTFGRNPHITINRYRTENSMC
ncbi:hypothetical protein RFI_18686, partial [Reticulomyxa filosa]